MALARINDNKLTKRQKIAFYTFIHNIYTLDLETLKIKYSKLSIKEIDELKYFGFCYMAFVYFDITVADDEFRFKTLFPELYEHKPKRNDFGGFWFSLGKGQFERIKIVKTILNGLK